MEKITSYSVVGGSSIDSLARNVNDAIAKGYQPHGDLVFLPGVADLKLVQPMVKKE